MIRRRTTLARLCLAMLVAAPVACSNTVRDAADLASQAQQLFDSGQPGPAYVLIGRSIRERDDQPDAYVLQGRIALALDRREDAYRAYANAVSLDAANPEALLGVAQTGVSVGRLVEADDAADKILALDPDQENALLVKGIVRLVRNDLGGAIEYSDRILATRTGDMGATILKARALALRGDQVAALALIRSDIAKVGETRELAMSLAELQRIGAPPDVFLLTLQRIRQLAPDNRDYRVDLIDTLYRLGRVDDARHEAAALAKEPALGTDEADRLPRLFAAFDHDGLTDDQITAIATKASVDTRMVLARFYITNGRPAAAITLLRPLATGWSGDIQSLYARAIGAAGDTAAARGAANAIVRRDPNNGDALLILAGDALARHDAITAIIDYQRVIHDYPQWEEGYLGLAQAYAADGKPSGVRRAFEDGRTVLPQDLRLARAYIAALLDMDDRDHALEVARRFALDSPSLGAAWALYGVICAKTSDTECRSEAGDGATQARNRFGLDPAPGTPPPTALIGRLP